jgi:UDP-N-acetylmuramoyl-L-alanyl-D-glutamate--2,6-diaminopimelate ligase
MTLAEMLEGVTVIRSTKPTGIKPAGVAFDSRQIREGDVFVAVSGLVDDGLDYIPQALNAGASAIVVGRGRFERAVELAGTGSRAVTRPSDAAEAVEVIEVEDDRKALAILSRNGAGRPDESMKVFGVTGTNGKTTTAHLLAFMIQESGDRCGLLGTLQYQLGSRTLEASRTTPESTDLYGYLQEMVKDEIPACVMEVSSHALALDRVHGLKFHMGIFTNLTRDHLDYHLDMESYYAAKKKLFEQLGESGTAILNADDEYGRRLAGDAGSSAILYGESAGADIRMTAFSGDLNGSQLTIETEEGTHRIETRLVGRLNAPNVLASVAAARSYGIDWTTIQRAIAKFQPVRGRMERVESGQPFTVIVDYAHTDDALKNSLEALRPLTAGRLLVVFGAGGDKDHGKRAPMGEHAARLSDRAWITSDNPRGEDPEAIIKMVMAGAGNVPGGIAKCEARSDRRQAIGAAIRNARRGDTVLIAGKGHESIQVEGSQSRPFDDVQVARECIEALIGNHD